MLKLLISCEHGGNEVPAAFAHVFPASAKAILESHRGVDIGALALAKTLAQQLRADAYDDNTLTRLLIDFNRSLHHANVFSEFSQTLSESEKQSLIQRHYLPYRDTIEQTITQWIVQGHDVLHLSVHSFTPKLKGEVRNADIGLLYDPKRALEVNITQQWLKQLRQHTALNVRCNYPYRGTADGFTTTLRKKFPTHYAGIELETNQALWQKNAALIQQTQHSIAQALAVTL